MIGILTGLFLAAATPGPWVPVQTNAIERWKSEHAAPDGIFVDKANRKVTILAEATGLKRDEMVEFIAIGPESDRAYESLLVTVAEPQKIADAIMSVGVPKGLPVNVSETRFWPQGEEVTISINGKPLGEYVAEMVATNEVTTRLLAGPIRFTGGTEGANQMPPCAVFATYACGQSQLQFDSRLTQAEIYGRFKAARTLSAGELVELTVAWNGKTHIEEQVYKVDITTDIDGLEARIREASKHKTIFARLEFAHNVSITRARIVATMFKELDGLKLRMNGRVDGQFYYGAFLPDEQWRARSQRIFQPFEFRPSGKGGVFTFVAEDWSRAAVDPLLRPIDCSFKNCSEVRDYISRLPSSAQKITVMFIYLPPNALIGDAVPILKAVDSRIDTFYIFRE